MADTLKRHEIERYAIDSSSIKSAGYSDGLLIVEFINGHLYAYAMPHAEFEKFAAAESKGRYFNQTIKGRFNGEKLTGRCGGCGSEPEVIGEPCRQCGAAMVRAIDTVHKEQR